ncbi:hypothetical protein SAMN04488136_101316 [Vibrio xiamenensis]|uniref:Ankyrin repeat-containing protein n=1 Tax=Vibrio xiamenensis TaxID=861298 RepID=A0A1G7WEB9_9VIBR|nr:hypothetical protein [Vibrio xiamenensis]SDG69510.1 hypothetical protein SAMN04488136_101316 [Vibrio xiamenensis]
MVIKNMMDIKQKLAQGNFGMLKADGIASWLTQLVKEDNGISMINDLRAGGAISDLDLYSWLVKRLAVRSKQTRIGDHRANLLMIELQSVGPIEDFNTLFTLIEASKIDPEVKAKVTHCDYVGHVLLLLADIVPDGTLIRNMRDVEHHFSNQHFAFLKANNVSRWVNDIAKHKRCLPMFEELRRHNVISDLDIYQQLDHNKVIWELEAGRTHEILSLLKTFPRDGSLVIDDSEDIWHIANDYSLPLIRELLAIGAEIDHNALLANTFAGDHNREFSLLDFLLGHYEVFSEQALVSACACILSETAFRVELSDQNAIKTLLGKIHSLDTVFDQNIYWANWHRDDYSLFGLLFRLKPEWLIRWYPDYVPSESAMEGMDWDFVVCEGEFDKYHLTELKNLVSQGAELPIEEIIEALDDNDQDDYAEQLRVLSCVQN